MVMRAKTLEELKNEIRSKLGLSGRREVDNATSIGELTSYASRLGIPLEVEAPQMRPKTLDELKADLIPKAHVLKRKVVKEFTTIDQVREFAQKYSIPLEFEAPEPSRKMSAAELEEDQRQEAEKREMGNEERLSSFQRKKELDLRKEQARIRALQEKEDKFQRKIETEFTRTRPETEEEAQRRIELLRESEARRESLLHQRNLAEQHREEVRQAVLRAKETNKLTAEQQFALLQEQQKVPQTKIDQAIKGIQDADVVKTEQMPTWLTQLQKIKAEGAVREYNRPYEPYLGQQIATDSPEELTSKIRVIDLDPFQGETLQRLNNIQDRIQGIDQHPAQRAAAPYLTSPDQSFQEAHRDLFGERERDMVRMMRESSEEQWLHDILPSIKDKYAIPGVRHHGHRARDEERALKKFKEGSDRAIAEMLFKNLGTTVGGTLQHQAQQTEKAKVAHNAGVSDAAHQLAAIDALQRAQHHRYSQQDKYVEVLNRMGEKEKGQEQQRLNLEQQRFNEMKNFNQTKLESLANITQGHPISKTVTESQGMRPMQMQAPQSTYGQMMGSLGAQYMPRNSPFKKGGRVKKAIGGTLSPIDPIQDAINWSIIDKEMPMDEIKRDIRRQRAMGMMNMMKSRRQYATGGGVAPIGIGLSPISIGASIADDVSYKEKVKRAKIKAFEQAEQDQMRVEQPMLTQGVETAFRAINRSPDMPGMRQNWLQRMAPAVTGAFDDRKAEENEFRAQRQAAIDRQVKMLEGDEAAERDERHFALEEKKADSVIKHHRAMERIASQNASKVKPAVSEKSRRVIDKAIKKFGAWQSVRNSANNAQDELMGVPTGKWSSKLGSLGAAISSPVHALTEKGTSSTGMSKYQDIDKASEALLTSLKAANSIDSPGGRITNEQFNQLKASKVSGENTIDTNESFLATTLTDSEKHQFEAINTCMQEPGGLEDAEGLLHQMGYTLEDFIAWKKGEKRAAPVISLRDVKKPVEKIQSSDFAKTPSTQNIYTGLQPEDIARMSPDEKSNLRAKLLAMKNGG